MKKAKPKAPEVWTVTTTVGDPAIAATIRHSIAIAQKRLRILDWTYQIDRAEIEAAIVKLKGRLAARRGPAGKRRRKHG